MKKGLVIIVFIVSNLTTSFSQNNDTIYKAYVSVQNEEINFSSLKKIKSPKISDYQGSYHFGDSEAESQLEILYSNDQLFARTEYNDWENNTWVLKHHRESVTYEKGILYIGDISYQLYVCADDSNLFLKKGTKGLASFYNEIENEKVYHYLQFNDDSLVEKSFGEYPETSFVKLSVKDLQRYSKRDLKIIRNEIFARNGFIFKKGGEMERYFLQKKWYNSIDKTNTPSLDTIENHNVNLILKLEKL